ncbi:MAG TPA: hypothetical protein VF528_07100 [Pyrinomonadaceae bacterium]
MDDRDASQYQIETLLNTSGRINNRAFIQSSKALIRAALLLPPCSALGYTVCFSECVG